MPFATPSYSQLQATVLAEILASGQAPNGLLPVSVLRILGQCIAQESYLHTEFLRWISLQSVPFTATEEYLDAWAALKHIYRYPATPSTATVSFSGTPDGTLIPVGTVIQRIDQIGFQTTTSANVLGGLATASVIATTAGSASNGMAGLLGNLNSPIIGVATSVTFATAATGGTDPETDSDLRTRMLAAFAAVGSAGSISDYVEWAQLATGITRVWCNPWGFGIGTILLYAMADTINAANNGFLYGTNGVASSETRWPQPATGDQLRIANAVYPLQPIGATVFVASPTGYNINVNISNLSINITASLLSALLAAFQSYLLSVATPLGCTVYLSGLEAEVQAVVGQRATFDMLSPISDVVIPIGYLPLITAANITVT